MRGVDEFERGQLSPAEWAERFIHDWDVDLRPDAFLNVHDLVAPRSAGSEAVCGHFVQRSRMTTGVDGQRR